VNGLALYLRIELSSPNQQQQVAKNGEEKQPLKNRKRCAMQHPFLVAIRGFRINFINFLLSPKPPTVLRHVSSSLIYLF